MEPAVAGTLYAAKEIIEYGVAFAKGVFNPTAPLKATFRKLNAPSLPRSSHTLTVVKDRAYIFGGEIKPREPVDNDMHMVVLPSGNEKQEADYAAIPARAAVEGGGVPAPRVGHSAARIGNCVYIFGGRGGPEMAPLDEKGRVWSFDTTTKTWTPLDPPPNTPVPEPRSYHASVATEHPLPLTSTPAQPTSSTSEPSLARDQPTAEPPVPHTYGTLLIHAGCPASGRRADVWAFDIASRTWAAFPDAPGAPRGGTSLAMVKDRVYRFGGFDGTREIGGCIDVLRVAANTFNDKGGRGEMALAPLGPWSSETFPSALAAAASSSTPVDGTAVISPQACPLPRSVAALLPITTGQGRHYLATLFGETSPSNDGHAAAGNFLSDIWTLQLPPEGMTAASLKDATRLVIGKETGQSTLAEVKYYDAEGVLVQEGQDRPAGARGWFGADVAEDLGGVVVWGGVEEGNGRLGDGWVVTFE